MSYRGNLNNTDPVHQYLDINIVNNDTQGNKPPVKLIFNEIRNSPIIQNPSEYFFSVVRFSLDTPSLPLMIPQVLLSQIDPNKLIYSITLTYESPVDFITYEKQLYIQYISQNDIFPVPNNPIVKQDFGDNSEYYYIYNFQWWIKLVNNTFTNCLNDLNTIVFNATGQNLPSQNAPFMEWDPYTKTAVLNADNAGFNNTLTNPINIYFNTPMFTLFSSFQANYKGFNNITNGKNYLILVQNFNDTNILNLPNYNAIQMYQDYGTSAIWCPISSIVFSTGTIPINMTQVSAPVVLNSEINTGLYQDGNNANISATISDFVVPLSDGTEYVNRIFYAPTSEYRMLDMLGNNPLNNISITVYWQDKFGGLHPFYLNSGCGANIKIMLRRKDYNMAKF